jgi:serine/threonine-protein kinase
MAEAEEPFERAGLGPGPGTRLGEYVLESILGTGAFATVYRARHVAFPDDVVAAKILSPRGSPHWLRREAEALRTLDHPRIVRVRGFDPEHSPPYLLLELVAGPSLRELLGSRGRLTPHEACRLTGEVLEGLAHAHVRSGVHADLKPENVLLDAEGHVRLTDFGAGRTSDAAGRAPAGGVTLSTDLASSDAEGGRGAIVSHAYAAPEVLAGAAADARADLYALGVMLFEMLVGERPQPGDDLRTRVPEAPASLAELVSRCYCRVEARYASAVEAGAALERAVRILRAASGAGSTVPSAGSVASRVRGAFEGKGADTLERLAEEAEGRVEALRIEAEARFRRIARE